VDPPHRGRLELAADFVDIDWLGNLVGQFSARDIAVVAVESIGSAGGHLTAMAAIELLRYGRLRSGPGDVQSRVIVPT
jgi:hypothetical protein